MGCNIHVHIEVKLNGGWEHLGHPHIKRNYPLFAKMAGVRNWDGSGITPLRPHPNLPDDATFLTCHCSNLDNYHDFGWLDRQQISELVTWYEEMAIIYPQLFDPHWGLEGVFGFLPEGHGWAAEAGRSGFEDWRFIFWFDN